MKINTTFIATKKEVLDLLKLLAKLSDCYTHVNKESKELVLYTALKLEDRDLDKMLSLNRQLAELDSKDFDKILNANNIALLNK